MAKRTLNQMANLITRRVDKSTLDTTFIKFCEDLLNLTLQEIIAQVPYAGWLLDEDTLALSSGVQFVAVPSDLDTDNIVSLRDETNNFSSRRITPEEADLIDPGRDLTGLEFLWWIQRVGTTERFYFINRPDSTHNLSVIFGNIITDPTTNQTSALPAKYESIWMDGTMAKLHPRIQSIDPNLYMTKFIGGYGQGGEPFGMQRIVHDARKRRGQSDVMASHRRNVHSNDFGPRFPADFDILP